jgi:hypothetical protein
MQPNALPIWQNFIIAKSGVTVSLPPAPSYNLQPSDEGIGLPVRRCLVSSLQWVVAPFRGMWIPRAQIFGGVLTVWVPTLPNLIWSKSFLPGHAYHMSESSFRLGMYPWSSYYVRQRWDGFDTRVRAARWAWAFVAMSHRARHLRLPLLEAPRAGKTYTLLEAPRHVWSEARALP